MAGTLGVLASRARSLHAHASRLDLPRSHAMHPRRLLVPSLADHRPPTTPIPFLARTADGPATPLSGQQTLHRARRTTHTASVPAIPGCPTRPGRAQLRSSSTTTTDLATLLVYSLLSSPPLSMFALPSLALASSILLAASSAPTFAAPLAARGPNALDLTVVQFAALLERECPSPYHQGSGS